MIPYNKQKIFSKDSKLVLNSLKKKFLTGGNYVSIFENKIKSLVKSKYVVACSSGTAALHLSFLSLNLKKDAIVIMPIINFISSTNVANLMGLKVYYCDVDEITGQITPELLIDCIKKNKLKRFDLLVMMYLGGYADDVDLFNSIKKKYKFKILEDACHAFGSEYKCKNKAYKVGSCAHADISTFSLHPLKTFTTGEGGIITTNNAKIHKKLKLLRSHGIVRKKNKHWDYDVALPGLNYRLSDINCALGISQLSNLDLILKKRKKIALKYFKFFIRFKKFIKLRNINFSLKNSFHLFVVNINFKKLKTTKIKLIKFFIKNRIMLQQHYIPIYKFKFYKNLSNKKYNFAEKYFNDSISFPIFFDLNNKSYNHIIKTFRKFIKINE
jgi:UDP-4-amino-4,6-dideoxy-L-N-acetyl-beta-L-altrosamine transaminase